MPLPAAPTVRVGTKRTPGAGLWPGGIRRERTNDNRDRFYLKRRAAVFAAGQARSVDLPWSGRSRTGEYLSRGIGTYIGGDRLPHLICCGSNLRLAHDKVQPAPQSIRMVEITMVASDFKTVDEYIAAQPETARVVLKRVRITISKALPGAVEVMSYKMPAYKLRGGVVLYFAGWKQHYSLYPAGERLVAAFKDQTGMLLGQQGHNPFSIF